MGVRLYHRSARVWYLPSAAPRTSNIRGHAMDRSTVSFRLALAGALLAVLATPSPAHAYIGPGAGFAVLSSFMVVFTTILIAIASLLAWPFRTLWRLLRRKAAAPPPIR